MPQYPSCATINSSPNKNCYECLNSNILNSENGVNNCYWSDIANKCSNFQDNTNYYNKSSSVYDATKCVKPPSNPNSYIDDKCTVSTDCKEKTGGKCFYDYDYENPSKKCYYPCTADSDCKTTGEKCISRGGISATKYCAVPEYNSIDDNDASCITNFDCKTGETCRVGFNGRKTCGSSFPLSNYIGSNIGSGFSFGSGSTNYYNIFDKNQETEEQLVSDLQNLQSIEEQLITSLGTATDDSKNSIIEKINNITTMRLNLYKSLNNLNSFYSSNIDSSGSSIAGQNNALQIMEEELNKTKQKLLNYQDDKNSKIRLIQINTYYSQRYTEHSDIMKYIIFTFIPIIILMVLSNNEIIPNIVFYALSVVIFCIGFYFIIQTLSTMWFRDSNDYQKFEWDFDPKTAPPPLSLNKK